MPIKERSNSKNIEEPLQARLKAVTPKTTCD